MLVELNVVEQRYRVVLEVLEDGLPVTEVAMRHGVSRQTVHTWLRRYRASREWRDWSTAPGDRRGVRTRSRRRWSAWCVTCAVTIRAGGRGAWSTSCAARAWPGFQDAPASIACWTATSSSSPLPGVASAPCTGAGSGLVRWSSGRWTW